ncbi:MAG: tetratricopeptide repeat protein, partial [Chloroflexi bacterium]
QIAARLDNVFHLLTSTSRAALPRQQTLRATIDWSYALLSQKEQLLLRRLAVFAGGWTLESVEAVCTGEDINPSEVLDLLTGLVDKSLALPILPESDDRQRYRMLETVHQYACELLAREDRMNTNLASPQHTETCAGDALRDRHLHHFLQMSEQAAEQIHGPRQLEWLSRLENELENLRAALAWSLRNGQISAGLQLATALLWFWNLHSRDAEGLNWLKRLLEARDAAAAAAATAAAASTAAKRENLPQAMETQTTDDLLIWIRAVNAVAVLHSRSPGTYSEEQRRLLLEKSIHLCRGMGETAGRELAMALIYAGYRIPLDPPRAERLFKESLEISRRNQYRYEEVLCLFFWGWHILNDPRKSAGLFEACLAISRELGDTHSTAGALVNLGDTLWQLGEYNRARLLMEEGIAIFQKVGDLNSVSIQCIYRYYMFPESVYALQYEEALAFLRDHPYTYSAYSFYIAGIAEWSLGNYDRAERLAQESLAANLIYAQELSFSKCAPYILLCRIAISQSKSHQARQHFKALVSQNIDFSNFDPWNEIDLIDCLAMFLSVEGRIEPAVKVSGAAEPFYRRAFFMLPQRQRSERDAALTAASQALGEEAFARAWQAGQAMTLQQALAYGTSKAGIEN